MIHNIFEKKKKKIEEAEMMLIHNIKLLSLRDLNLWPKKKIKINLSKTKVII